MNKLRTFEGKRFENVMDLMYALQQAGFEHEFDNGLLLRALWEAVDRLWKRAERKAGMYLILAQDPQITADMVMRIQLYSSGVETAGVYEEVRIVQRADSLSVYDHIILAKAPERKHDLSMLGKAVDWNTAHEVLMTHPRFSHYAVEAFKAVRGTAKPKDSTTPHHIRLTPTQTGMHVAFMVAGKPVLSITLDYSYEAMAA